MKKRVYKLCFIFSLLIVLGIIYYLFIETTGWAMPCIIEKIFHVECPTCGITRMILSLLKGNIEEAISYNYCLFYMLPFITIFIIIYCIRYIKNGKIELNKFLAIYLFIILLILSIWFIVRNIYSI